MIEKTKYFKNKPELASILDLVILCVVTIIIGKLLTVFIILPGFVPSGSMQTTIMKDDRILTNLTSYWNSEPQRGDIAVFYFPDDMKKGVKTHYVKRIIGLPGETVSIQDGNVYINGELLDEPYLTQKTNVGDSYTVPEGHYFMLGDNRNGSEDSRFWQNKFVPKEDILGTVFFKYSLIIDNVHAEIMHSYHDYNIK